MIRTENHDKRGHRLYSSEKKTDSKCQRMSTLGRHFGIKIKVLKTELSNDLDHLKLSHYYKFQGGKIFFYSQNNSSVTSYFTVTCECVCKISQLLNEPTWLPKKPHSVPLNIRNMFLGRRSAGALLTGVENAKKNR